AFPRRSQRHGRTPRRLAGRSFQRTAAVPLLSEATLVRHRPRGHGPSAHRTDRSQTQVGARPLHLRPLARAIGRQSRPQQEPIHPRARTRRVRRQAWTRRLRLGQDSGKGGGVVMLLLLAAALPRLFWEGAPDTAPALKEAGITQIVVPASGAPAWKSAA